MSLRGILPGLAVVFLATGLSAQSPTGLVKLGDRDDLLGWEAVGRLDQEGVGFCTGTLIAPDLVLTAAHCVCPGQLTDDGGQRREAGHCASTAFVSTWQDGVVGSTQEASVFVHPDFVTEVSAASDSSVCWT